MGSGNDMVRPKVNAFHQMKFSQCITLDNGQFVDGGAGRDTLSDSSFSSNILLALISAVIVQSSAD